MAKDTNPSAAPASPSKLRRLLPYIVFALVVVGFFLWFNSDGQEIQRHINSLHSDDHRTRKEHLGNLREHPNKKLVNELLLKNLQDADMAWSVRRMCGSELMRRERLPDLERALQKGDLGTRTVVMDVLSKKDFFKKTWAADPRYRVRDTLGEWLRDEGSTHRARAVQLAKELDWREGLTLIRPLLRRSDRGNVNRDRESRILEAAASAVQRFGDCESVPALVELARNDPAGKVRMRAMQELHRMVFEHDTCPGAISDDVMKELIVARLKDEESPPRMAAMIIYKLQPAWAGESVDTLTKYLADTSRRGGERRLALEVLIATDDPTFQEALPRWFYDADKGVRSSAAQAVGKFRPSENPFLSSLIGVMRNEAENQLAFRAGAETLRKAAGAWHGIPARLQEINDRTDQRTAVLKFLNTLFQTGETEGIARADFARAWFRWHAQRLKLDAAQTDAATKTYEAFWKAADRGDANGAKAALDADTSGATGLFADARGWLAAR